MCKNIGLINNFANIQPKKNCSYLFFFNDLCLQNILVCNVLWFQSNFRVQNDSKNKKIALERNWLTLIHKTIFNIIPIFTNKSLSYIIECLLFTLYNLNFYCWNPQIFGDYCGSAKCFSLKVCFSCLYDN